MKNIRLFLDNLSSLCQGIGLHNTIGGCPSICTRENSSCMTGIQYENNIITCHLVTCGLGISPILLTVFVRGCAFAGIGTPVESDLFSEVNYVKFALIGWQGWARNFGIPLSSIETGDFCLVKKTNVSNERSPGGSPGWETTAQVIWLCIVWSRSYDCA